MKCLKWPVTTVCVWCVYVWACCVRVRICAHVRVYVRILAGGGLHWRVPGGDKIYRRSGTGPYMGSFRPMNRWKPKSIIWLGGLFGTLKELIGGLSPFKTGLRECFLEISSGNLSRFSSFWPDFWPGSWGRGKPLIQCTVLPGLRKKQLKTKQY